MRCARGLAEVGQAIALTHLKFLDQPPPRVTLLCQFDRGVRKIAATLVLGDEFRRLLDKTVKLADRLARVGSFDLRPNLVGLLSLVVQILENQFVLRAEVAIERHLIGARRFSYGFDPNSADAMAVEQVLRARNQSLPGTRRADLRCNGLPVRV